MNIDLSSLEQLTGLSQEWLLAYLLVFLRIGTTTALLPLFGEQFIPQRVRLAIALSFTAIVASALSKDQMLRVDFAFSSFAAEVAAGLTLGLALRIVLTALQMAGSMIAQATSISQLFAGVGPEPQPAITNLLMVTAFAIAIAGGILIKTVEFFLMSFDLIPLGGWLPVGDVAQLGMSQVSAAFSLAVVLSMPFAVASLLYNLLLGFINRAMPTLMVSFIGAPALAIGALVMLFVAGPAICVVWLKAFFNFLSTGG
jgi:flagellar biosynthetic protein FliR